MAEILLLAPIGDSFRMTGMKRKRATNHDHNVSFKIQKILAEPIIDFTNLREMYEQYSY